MRVQASHRAPKPIAYNALRRNEVYARAAQSLGCDEETVTFFRRHDVEPSTPEATACLDLLRLGSSKPSLEVDRVLALLRAQLSSAELQEGNASPGHCDPPDRAASASASPCFEGVARGEPHPSSNFLSRVVTAIAFLIWIPLGLVLWFSFIVRTVLLAVPIKVVGAAGGLSLTTREFDEYLAMIARFYPRGFEAILGISPRPSEEAILMRGTLGPNADPDASPMDRPTAALLNMVLEVVFAALLYGSVLLAFGIISF